MVSSSLDFYGCGMGSFLEPHAFPSGMLMLEISLMCVLYVWEFFIVNFWGVGM